MSVVDLDLQARRKARKAITGKAWKEANKERGVITRRAWRETHVKERAIAAKAWYKTNKDRVLEYMRNKRIAAKREAMEAYGGCKCRRCGIKDIDVLCIDHIKDNGKAHRITMNASKLYGWLKKHGFPPGFQVLCANCNLKKEIMRLRGEI